MLEVKLKIDFKYMSDNPDPTNRFWKNNIVHECEVLCITIAYNKQTIPYAFNRPTESISGEKTSKKTSNQAIERHVCIHHRQRWQAPDVPAKLAKKSSARVYARYVSLEIVWGPKVINFLGHFSLGIFI